jgi:hypothetical protein
MVRDSESVPGTATTQIAPKSASVSSVEARNFTMSVYIR